MPAWAGDEVADRGCLRLDLRGAYDDGDGKSCNGVPVEGVFVVAMVPDQRLDVKKTKK